MRRDLRQDVNDPDNRVRALMRPEQLHVISVISNPIRYKSRPRLFKEFVERMLDSGVSLWIVEAQFGERDYEVAKEGHYNHIRLNCSHELWSKEAMINAGRRFLPADAKYIAWQDGDIAYVRDDWAVETLHELQNFPVVQTWSHCIDLGPHFEPMGQSSSFAYLYREKDLQPDGHRYNSLHPGYGWAWRREAWDSVGGMLDIAILGSGDNHMATGLVGKAKTSLYPHLHPNYRRAVLQWQDRATQFIQGNIGYTKTTINHYFHGKKSDRKYDSRWKILVEYQFDPEVDIIRDGDGMFRLRGNKPGLRDAIQRYFRQRSEDYHP